MASSIRRLISNNAASCLRRPWISLSLNRGCSKLSDGGDSSLEQVPSPWLLLPPSFANGGGGGMSYNFHSLAENKVVTLNKMSEPDSAESPNDDALFVGSSHGWLALHNQRGDRGLFLSNPITGDYIKLPPLHYGDDVEKVILSGDPRDRHCRAVATLNGARLAFCSHWTTRITGSLPYGDFTYSTAERLVFCVRNSDDRIYDDNDDDREKEELEAWDATIDSSPGIYCMDRLHNHDRSQPWEMRTVPHLVYVEDAHKLLLLRRRVDGEYPFKTVGFEVYVINGLGLQSAFVVE